MCIVYIHHTTLHLPSVNCAAVCRSEQLLTTLIVSLPSASSSVAVMAEASAACRPLPAAPLRPPRSVTDQNVPYTIQYLLQTVLGSDRASDRKVVGH